MPEIDLQTGCDYPVLSAFMRCRESVSFIRGPLGSGKTIGTVQRLLHQMAEHPVNEQGVRRTRWLAVRNTYLDLTQTTIKDFLNVFEGLGTMKYGGLEPPNFRACFMLEDRTRVEAEVIFLALDRDDAIRKLKGYQVNGIWFNELSEIRRDIVDMADLRLGRFSKLQGGTREGWYGWFGDTNSYDDSHWLYSIEMNPPDGWAVFVQPGGVFDTGERDIEGEPIWAVNPGAENVKHLPDGYYERGVRGKPAMWVRVFLANKHGYVQRGLPVHPRFSEDLHVLPRIDPLPQYPIDIGADFGRTPAVVLGQDWRHIGRYVAIRCLTSENMSAELFAPEVKRLLDKDFSGYPVRAWGDPSGDAGGQAFETTPIEVFRAKGIPMQPAPSNNPTLRCASLDAPLTRLCMDGRPAYMASKEGCGPLIKGLSGGFHYPELKISGVEKRYHEKWLKNMDSHVCEAEQYRLYGSGEGQAVLRLPEHMRPQNLPAVAEGGWW